MEVTLLCAPSVVNPDNSFEVLVDQTVVNSGNLLTDMTPPVNPPAEIEDPDDHKPEDWDERPKIQDPDAVKPEDWSVLQFKFISSTPCVDRRQRIDVSVCLQG